MNNDFYAVGIGASAGGLKAICTFFDNLTEDIGAAYFVITHLDKNHKSLLNEILAKHTNLPVVRVTEQMIVKPNTVYLLIENTMLTVNKKYVVPRLRTESEKVNKAVNIFFSSLAKTYTNMAVGIILSGNGEDGAEGAVELNEYGGKVLVQTPLSSSFAGMPISVIKNDDPMAIKEPSELANKLVEIIKSHPNHYRFTKAT